MFPANDQGQVILTPELEKTLLAIQKKVNADVTYKTDQELYNHQEKWAYPKVVGLKMYGDCEDYSLEKLWRCAEAGVPRSCLLMTICTIDGDGHCVLSVVTDKKDFILCNNHEGLTTPKAMTNEGYKFLYRQTLGKKINEPWDKVT